MSEFHTSGPVNIDDPTAFIAQTAASAPPLTYGSALDGSLTDPPAPLHWRTFELAASDPDVQAFGPKGVIGWEARIDDLRGGYQQYGDFGRGSNQYDGDYRMTSRSFGVDTRFRRHLILSQLRTTTTLGTSFANANLFWVNLNGVLIMGGGNVANFSLYTEVSGVPAAVTYSPASKIQGLYKGVIGGATSAERLFVCMQSTAIDVHSVAGTSLGSMNAVTVGASGLMSTPINAATPGTPQLLIYTNNSMYVLPVSSAIGAAPTAVLTGLPNGGAALQIEQVPKNLPLRAYWIMPDANLSTSWLPPGGGPGTSRAKIWHTNLEGTDRQLVPLPLTNVMFAGFWRRNLVATDGNRIVTWDGDITRDLHVQNNRYPNSDLKRQVDGLLINDNDLYALITWWDISANGALGNTVQAIEQYLPEFDAWVQVSANWVPTSIATVTDGSPYIAGMQCSTYSPTLPFSTQSGRMFLSGETTKWYSQFLPPAGANPYYQYRATPTGFSTTGVQQWETTGTWYSPYYSLPTLEGRMKKVDQIIFGGAVDEGNVKVIINPNQGGTAVTFAGTDVTRSQPAPTGQNLFDLLQVSIQLNQGASTYRTPNGLPVTIRGRAYMNDPNIQSLGLPGGFI